MTTTDPATLAFLALEGDILDRQVLDNAWKQMPPEWKASLRAAWIDEIRAAYAPLLRQAADALLSYRDDMPCRLDHHGYCQEHASLTEGPCVQMDLRAALAALRAALGE